MMEWMWKSVRRAMRSSGSISFDFSIISRALRESVSKQTYNEIQKLL